VSIYKSTELAQDKITNTLYFDDSGLTTDAPGLATALANLYATYRIYPTGWDRVNVRFYDMAEPIPREIQGEATSTASGGGPTAAGPREVALCLSFYAERNLPRNRGRVYVGPFASSAMSERPTSARTAELNVLKDGLADLGGADVMWCVYSPTSGPASNATFKKITAGWIDDEWDTMRSRGLRAILRNAWTKEG
jgi:hypothetical protein